MTTVPASFFPVLPTLANSQGCSLAREEEASLAYEMARVTGKNPFDRYQAILTGRSRIAFISQDKDSQRSPQTIEQQAQACIVMYERGSQTAWTELLKLTQRRDCPSSVLFYCARELQSCNRFQEALPYYRRLLRSKQLEEQRNLILFLEALCLSENGINKNMFPRVYKLLLKAMKTNHPLLRAHMGYFFYDILKMMKKPEEATLVLETSKEAFQQAERAGHPEDLHVAKTLTRLGIFHFGCYEGTRLKDIMTNALASSLSVASCTNNQSLLGGVGFLQAIEDLACGDFEEARESLAHIENNLGNIPAFYKPLLPLLHKMTGDVVEDRDVDQGLETFFGENSENMAPYLVIGILIQPLLQMAEDLLLSIEEIIDDGKIHEVIEVLDQTLPILYESLRFLDYSPDWKSTDRYLRTGSYFHVHIAELLLMRGNNYFQAAGLHLREAMRKYSLHQSDHLSKTQIPNFILTYPGNRVIDEIIEAQDILTDDNLYVMICKVAEEFRKKQPAKPN